MTIVKVILTDNTSNKLLPEIKKEIENTFNATVQIEAAIGLPKEFYNHLRHQFVADKILRFLSDRFAGKKLAITDEDLYTEDLNFVFGQAMLAGNEAVVSTHRLNPKLYRQKEDQILFIKRVVKEAVHEVGHMFGLKHCGNQKCVMKFSNTIFDVDKKSKDFCENCRRQLRL